MLLEMIFLDNVSQDLRGQLGTELDEAVAYRIGRAYAEFVKPKNVVLGGDIRLTSESLKTALSEGIRDAGSDVIDIGMVGTEQVYFATSHLNAGMLTFGMCGGLINEIPTCKDMVKDIVDEATAIVQQRLASIVEG